MSKLGFVTPSRGPCATSPTGHTRPCSLLGPSPVKVNLSWVCWSEYSVGTALGAVHPCPFMVLLLLLLVVVLGVFGDLLLSRPRLISAEDSSEAFGPGPGVVSVSEDLSVL